MFWSIWFTCLVICVWYLLWIYVNKDETFIDATDEDWMIPMWVVAVIPVVNVILALVAVFHVFHKMMSPKTYKKD